MTLKCALLPHCISPVLQPAHSCGLAASAQGSRAPPSDSGVGPTGSWQDISRGSAAQASKVCLPLLRFTCASCSCVWMSWCAFLRCLFSSRRLFTLSVFTIEKNPYIIFLRRNKFKHVSTESGLYVWFSFNLQPHWHRTVAQAILAEAHSTPYPLFRACSFQFTSEDGDKEHDFTLRC